MIFLFSSAKKKLFVCMISFFSLTAPLLCGNHRVYPYGGYGPGDYSSGRNTPLEKAIFYSKLIAKEEKEIADLGNEEEKKQEKELRTRQLNILKSKFNRMTATDSSPMGTLVARGLAGEDWDILEDQEIKSISDGIWAGVTTRTARACGDVISDKIKGTAQTVIGGVWDSFLDTMLRWWNTATTALFYDSKKPFSPNEVARWKSLVRATLDDLQKIVREGPKDSLQGHGMVLRSFEEPSTSEEKSSVWEVFAQGYIDQFDYMVFVIQQRKEYYSSDDPAVFYAESVQKRLIECKELLIKTKTIKDLDDLLDSNKSILPALNKNIENLFDCLAKEVEPRSYSIAKNIQGSNGQNDRLGRQAGMYDEYDSSRAKSFLG